MNSFQTLLFRYSLMLKVWPVAIMLEIMRNESYNTFAGIWYAPGRIFIFSSYNNCSVSCSSACLLLSSKAALSLQQDLCTVNQTIVDNQIENAPTVDNINNIVWSCTKCVRRCRPLEDSVDPSTILIRFTPLPGEYRLLRWKMQTSQTSAESTWSVVWSNLPIQTNGTATVLGKG